MTRFMRKNGDVIAAVAAAEPDKAAVYEIGDDESGMRLDRWFRRRFPDLPQSHLMKIVRKGEVRVSGRRADVSTRLAAGENVRVPPLRMPAGQGPAVRRASPGDREAIRAMTLFEDRDVIVLDKPYGLAVQGGSGTKRHVDGMLEALADKNGERPVLVHRLDRDTSGVLLIAKSRKIAAELGATFRSRGAKKIYWALVEGVPKPAQGRISMFLAKGDGMGEARGAGPGRADLERMRVAKHGDPDAQHSLTLYAVVDKVAPRLAWLSCARSPAGPTSCAPIARRSAIRSSATRIQSKVPERSGAQRSLARGSARARTHAASPGAPPDPAPSARRTHRRDRAAAGAYEDTASPCSAST